MRARGAHSSVLKPVRRLQTPTSARATRVFGGSVSAGAQAGEHSRRSRAEEMPLISTTCENVVADAALSSIRHETRGAGLADVYECALKASDGTLVRCAASPARIPAMRSGSGRWITIVVNQASWSPGGRARRVVRSTLPSSTSDHLEFWVARFGSVDRMTLMLGRQCRHRRREARRVSGGAPIPRTRRMPVPAAICAQTE